MTKRIRMSYDEIRARSKSGENGGLVCPQCKCKQFKVADTEKGDDKIVRYRVCRNCGFHIRTHEIRA